MKYSLDLNLSGSPLTAHIDLPIEELDAINAFGVVVREVVTTAYPTVFHIIERDELLNYNALALQGQGIGFSVPVEIDWSAVFAIANTVVNNLGKEVECAFIEVPPFGDCTGKGGFVASNEPTKRLHIVFDYDGDSYDVDNGNGELDADKVREAVNEWADNVSNSALEDAVSEMTDAEYEADFDLGDESFSYEKKDILEAMGDWDDFVSRQRENVVNDVIDNIVNAIGNNGEEIAYTYLSDVRAEMREPEQEDE